MEVGTDAGVSKLRFLCEHNRIFIQLAASAGSAFADDPNTTSGGGQADQANKKEKDSMTASKNPQAWFNNNTFSIGFNKEF